MAKQPTTPKSLQSRNQAPAVGQSGVGTDPSTRENKDTDFKQPNVGDQGTNRHADMFTKTTPDDERGGEVDHSNLSDEEIAELEAAKLNAPDVDDDFDPDDEIDRGGNEEGLGETEDTDEDEDVLVRLLHPVGVHHINGHPLENGTVVSMKRGEFEGHQSRGMVAEEVGDDYDGDVYDTSEAWKPETEEA